MSTADAVGREAAWLTTSGDSLPALLANVGGPFDLIQGYVPRVPASQQHVIYVLRRGLKDERFANIQKKLTYDFGLRIVWPILVGTGSAETEQRALDAAIDLVLQRIRGPQLDKSHGNRFLSVAEDPSAIHVAWHDPEQTIGLKFLSAEITYAADDFIIND